MIDYVKANGDLHYSFFAIRIFSVYLVYTMVGRGVSVRDRMDSRLPAAIEKIQTGENIEAVELLREILLADSQSADAWYWLSRCVENPGQRTECLQRALRIDPQNALAAREMAEINRRQLRDTLQRVLPARPEPVAQSHLPEFPKVDPFLPGTLEEFLNQVQPARKAPAAGRKVQTHAAAEDPVESAPERGRNTLAWILLLILLIALLVFGSMLVGRFL